MYRAHLTMKIYKFVLQMKKTKQKTEPIFFQISFFYLSRLEDECEISAYWVPSSALLRDSFRSLSCAGLLVEPRSWRKRSDTHLRTLEKVLDA